MPITVTNRAVGLAVIAIAIIGLAVYAYFDPAGSVLFPKGPFRMLTGWDCPGCGSQRTIHALLHADIRQAFGYNPLLVLSILYLGAAGYLDYLGGRTRHPRLRRAILGRRACIHISLVSALYWRGLNIF